MLISKPLICKQVGFFCCCLNHVSNIVSTSFHVCLWSVVLKYREAQSTGVLSFTKEIVSPPVTGNFSCLVSLRQKDFYIRSFQTPMMVPYACLEIRPNHMCALFAAGIPHYRFPVLPTSLPTPPLVLLRFHVSSPEIPPAFSLLPFLDPYSQLTRAQSVLLYFISKHDEVPVVNSY